MGQARGRPPASSSACGNQRGMALLQHVDPLSIPCVRAQGVSLGAG